MDINGYLTSYKNSITLFLFNITRNKCNAKNVSSMGMRNSIFEATENV